MGRSRSRSRSPGTYRAEYARDGCVFPVRGLVPRARLDEVDQLLTKLVAERPENLAPEDLLNLHTTSNEVLALCQEPGILAFAKNLLGTEDIAVFTSRILCKLPGTGKEIPWHQDSNYWPLAPPGKKEFDPQVASVWLALDDVDDANGPMDVLPFPAQPESKGRNATEMIIDSGGDTAGFDNFNLSLDAAKLNVGGARRVLIPRGSAEWHSAWTIHRSDPNRSDRRRMAWIVRYVPTGTTVIPGLRATFDASYRILPVSGRGAVSSVSADGPHGIYSPCFGNKGTNDALKK